MRPFDLSAKNQDVEPILVEMKTKTIVLMLMFVLSWIATSGSACICSTKISALKFENRIGNENEYQFQLTDLLPSDSDDTCTDCGHSGTCCSSQSLSALSGMDSPLDIDAVITLYQPEPGLARMPDYHGAVRGTRAPPAVSSPTLVSSHQLLLI